MPLQELLVRTLQSFVIPPGVPPGYPEFFLSILQDCPLEILQGFHLEILQKFVWGIIKKIFLGALLEFILEIFQELYSGNPSEIPYKSPLRVPN